MKKALIVLFLLLFAVPVLASDSAAVVMNIKTYIYHKPTCTWAIRCTKSCVQTTKSDAIAKGARACKVCGG